MALAPGTRFGSYEVAEQIGSGGMGEVWRATDTNLKRDVALKVLPQAFVEDADRLARFKREAEILASLNHPNIATIHGLEKTDDQTIIVMELVEGPTLADRIKEGPIAPDEAMSIALQIIAALEAAHDKGIVHRDLKPANVKVRDDGTVKVLDFGISKPIDPAAISGSPVMTTPAVTQTGVILGTAAYMSPEQARGRFVDERTDIWAFGCLLFEMLTGQPAFGGEDVMLTLARVLANETNLQSIPATISAAVRHTIKLCLEKDPGHRISDIRDVRLALEGRFESEPAAAVAVAAARVPVWRRALAPVAAAALVLAVVFVLWPEPAPRPLDRFVHALPEVNAFRRSPYRPIAISPDGRRFVYNLSDGLYLREMGEFEARRLQGTEEDLRQPFFSPDGMTIAFHTGDDWLKRVSITGGAPTEITDAIDNIRGATWQGDTIYFSGPVYDMGEGIFRVSATGGMPESLIAAEDGEIFGSPRLLPDGDTLLFSVSSGGNVSNDTMIVAQSLSTGERTPLIPGGSDPRYLASGHLVYAFEDSLRAVMFDAETLEISGSPASVVQDVSRGNRVAAAYYDVSQDGTLVYVTGAGGSSALFSFVLVDRDGNEEVLGLDACNCRDPVISPDGGRLLYTEESDSEFGADVWIWSFTGEPAERRTFEERSQFEAIWSVDGESITYFSEGEGLLRRRADGTGQVEVLLESDSFMAPIAYDAEGTLIFHEQSGGPIAGRILPAGDGAVAETLLEPMDRASLSPDGNWIAYTDEINGRLEIFVRPYPDVNSGGPYQISEEGGRFPIWSRDGGRLYYVSASSGSRELVEVDIQTEPAFRRVGRRTVLDVSALQTFGGRVVYDVTEDDRFLFSRTVGVTTGNNITIRVVQNWDAWLAGNITAD